MNIADPRAVLADRLRTQLESPEYPLSYAQQRLWFLDQLHPQSAVYNLPLNYRIRGPLVAEALEYALNQVIRRHEVLRSAFFARDGAPRQTVRPYVAMQIPVTDLAGLPASESVAMQLAEEEARRPFDLAKGPLLRARLLRLQPHDHLLLLSLHHIAGDAWSLEIIGREISAFYRAYRDGSKPELAAVPIQFADISEWQRQYLQGPKRAELAAYWRERLAGIPACNNLPTDRPRPPTQSYAGSHIAFAIPADLVREVDALARRLGVTPFAVLLSAFALLLRRHTGGEEVVLGTPAANRHDVRLESAIGFFANMLVLRPTLAQSQSFAEAVTASALELRAALAHQDIPFELLVEELKPDRDPAHSPVFQVMFIYWDREHDAAWDLPGCEVASSWGDSATAKFDLTLSLSRTGATIRARLEYATALYDKDTAERMGAQFLRILESGLADPARALSTLELLPEAEHRLVAKQWAVGESLSPSPQPVHHRIAAQVARTPAAPAVLDGHCTLTYRQLDDAANALSDRLRALGVVSGSVVGVYLDRSVLTVVAMLAILKAGAAYLPLDPDYPKDRLSFMVADAGASIIVSRTALLSEAGALGATVVPADAVGNPPRASGDSRTETLGLAYLIYTSGSTGRPKGVRITHENLCAFLAAMDAKFGDDDAGTWLAVTSISFDISVLELLWTLTRGYRVVVRSDEPRPASARRQNSTPESAAGRAVQASLFFFCNAPAEKAEAAARYRTLLEAVRWADERGFTAAWIPERHFHGFGGLYPNPSVLGAALAASTRRIAIRAGSVVLPLHDPLRVAEEWALVDNLSGGRVGLSFASGWQPDDFVLAPDRYAERKRQMLDAIVDVRKLWRGERIRRLNGIGKEIEVGTYPRPIQKELPIWITSARHPETFRMAGQAGAGLLTHLVGHTVEQLAEKIGLYRSEWRSAGHPGNGHVTLMLHTFVGPDRERVKDTVRQPLKEYIRTSFDLMAGFGAAFEVSLRDLPAEEVEQLLDQAFDRFFATSGLLGTVQDVADTLHRLGTIGIDEVGCLIDFGVDDRDVLAALDHLAAARDEHRRRQTAALAHIEADVSIAAQLEQYEVTHLQCTPSLAGVLVADPKARDALRRLKRLLVGGEALPPELAADLAELVGGSVHNMYGPTEATVWATSSQVAARRPPVIGRPLAGYRTYVVDPALRPTPIGVPGELLIGGRAVAAGYHARCELTAERFLPDHLSGDAEGRLYRTGDLVRWRCPGELEFLGRLDHQVKLRGRRIELGEIEAALTRYPAVARAVCDVRGEADAKSIVAYCVLAPGQSLPPATDLRSFLGRTLPDHMLPTTFVRVEALPLTPNGKINRAALPNPDQGRAARGADFRAPRSELEQTIAAVWREVLHADKVGLDDNFFAIGGNSILVVAVRSRLLQRVAGELSLVDMFRYPTIASLATALSARSVAQLSGKEAITRSTAAGERRRGALARAQTRRAPAGERT